MSSVQLSDKPADTEIQSETACIAEHSASSHAPLFAQLQLCGAPVTIFRGSVCVQVLDGEGPAPTACTPDIMHTIIQQHLDCAAIFTILPLQASGTPSL